MEKDSKVYIANSVLLPVTTDDSLNSHEKLIGLSLANEKNRVVLLTNAFKIGIEYAKNNPQFI